MALEIPLTENELRTALKQGTTKKISTAKKGICHDFTKHIYWEQISDNLLKTNNAILQTGRFNASKQEL
jgi:hypothetical protein